MLTKTLALLAQGLSDDAEMVENVWNHGGLAADWLFFSYIKN